MATLLDFSDELIILVASHISKPSDILHLALTNKRVHGIAIEHLYGNITFDKEDYISGLSVVRERDRATGAASSVIRYDYHGPHPNIMHLANMIRSNTLPAGQTVTRLAITIGINNECNKFQTLLSLLLPQLSSLKDLTLKSVSDQQLSGQLEYFSLAPLAGALSPSSQTLRSLSMDFFQNGQRSDGWTIGSLRHFSNLKYLSLQGSVLLGLYGDYCSCMPSMDSILPPSLKRLRLHERDIEVLGDLSVLLSDFVKDSSRVSRETEELVVHLDGKAINEDLQHQVGLFERHLQDMNEESGNAGLGLRLALEWREDYRWLANTMLEFYYLRTDY